MRNIYNVRKLSSFQIYKILCSLHSGAFDKDILKCLNMILLAKFLAAQKTDCVPRNVVAVPMCPTLDGTVYKIRHDNVYRYVTFLLGLGMYYICVKMLRKCMFRAVTRVMLN
jgi:hypothetical protein